MVVQETYNTDLDDIVLGNLIRSLIEQGHTNKQIAVEIGKSVSSLYRFMKGHSICNSNLPRYNYKLTRFEIVDELSAYMAGLYWSDGHLAKDSLTITFWTKDEMLIKNIINKYFFGDFRAYRYIKDKRFITLKICNKQIRNDFFKLGLVNNDAGRTVPDMPDQFFRHFLRGMIDGDGHIKMRYKTCQLAGRLHLLNDVGTTLDRMGLKKSYGIHESPKSQKTRKINKYGVLTFKRYFLFNVFKLLYKNTSFSLPRKFQELNQLFSESGSGVDYLRRKHTSNYIRENREAFVKQYDHLIQYAFPRLFPKNIDVFRELKEELHAIREKIVDCKWEVSRVRRYLNKKGLEVSDSSLRRFLHLKGIIPNSIKERCLIRENKVQIFDAITSGENRRVISNKLGIPYRRVRRNTRGIKSDSHIEMVNPDFFEKIDTEKKAFFTGFLMIRNSINDKYLSLKCKDEKYDAILVHLAHALYGENIPNKMKVDAGFKYSFGSIKLISSLKNIFLHDKSSRVIDFIPPTLWRSFTLGMFYSGMKVQKIKTGYCSRISGNTDVMKWLQNFLKIQGITVRFESNNEKRLIFLQKDYELAMQAFGNEIHTFLTQGVYNSKILA